MTNPLVLASASERRVALLREYGYQAIQIPSNIEEAILQGETGIQLVKRLALTKLQAVKAQENVVVAADTAVETSDGAILGKPRSESQAFAMLGQLRGRTCRVFTGIALQFPKRGNSPLLSVVETRVAFRDFSEDHAGTYVATGEPLGKAGGFAIQGRGRQLIARIHGCYTNVVGLPMCELSRLLSIHPSHGSGQTAVCYTDQGDSCPRCGDGG